MVKSQAKLSTISKKKLVVETVGLQTPRGRLLFFGIVSTGIFLAPYSWLSHLSLWQYIGVNSPSIGLTRAYWRLLHGDVAGAYERNPLIFVVLAVGVPLLVFDIIKLARARKQL
jgi:hypothetical protein